MTLERDVVKELEVQFDLNLIVQTLSQEKLIASSKTKFETIEFWRGRGCKQCNQDGYKGRMGIYEVLPMSTAVAQLVIKRSSADEIKKKAAEEGMHTMLQDAFIKAKHGMTTIDEILRVTKE